MRWKTTTVLLLVTVGLGAFISLYEIKQPGTEERKRKSIRVLDLPQETITALEIDVPNAALSLRNQDGVWRLEPDGARADAAMVRQILSYSSGYTAERALEPEDLGAYGLEPPLGTIVFTAADGLTTTLRIGEPTPVGGNRYAMVEGRPDVYIVTAGLFDLANQDEELYADAFFFRPQRWEVAELRISTPEHEGVLTQEDGRWTLREPVADRADQGALSSLFNALAQTAIQRRVGPKPDEAALAEYGLAPPEAALTARLTDGREVTVSFGRRLQTLPQFRYAMRSDEPLLYAVRPEDVEKLLPDPGALRAKAPVEFFMADVRRVSVTGPEGAWTMSREEGAGWSSESEDLVLDGLKVSKFLGTLADLRAEGFAEDAVDSAVYGLDEPAGRIEIWTFEEVPQQVIVGAPVREGPSRYARLEPRGVTAILPQQLEGLLYTRLSDFTSSQPSE